MTKISRASLRSYTTTHLTYRPPDEARRLLHEHANAIILQAGKALAEILPESEASVAALDALGIARMRCNQAIAHDECDVDEAKARIAKADLQCGIAETVQAAADSMVEAIDRIDANPYLTSVLSQSIRSDLSVPNAGYAMGRRGHMTIARNLGGALPEPTDVADTNTAIASVIERLDTLADRLDGLMSVDVEFDARLGTLIEDGVDAEFAGDLPEDFDRQEAMSELAGYGFDRAAMLDCGDDELAHLVGQWRRFKAANTKAAEANTKAAEANTKAAEAKALAGLREIFGKFDLSADEAVESVRIMAEELDRHGTVQAGHLESMREQHKEVVALRSALAKSDADAEHLRSLLAEVGSLLLGPAGTPTEANVLGEAKALRGMVDGDHRLSAAFGQAGRQAEVKAKALSMLKQESADVDAEVKKLEGLLLGLDTGNPRTREDRVIALVEEAKRIRHLVAGMGCPSTLSDIIADRAKRASASNNDAFERGRADGQADVAARLRKLLDPSDEHKLSLDGLLKSVGYLVRVEDSLNAVVSADGKAPARVDCPPEGMLVRRGWNGVRLGGDAEEVTPVYLCARDGGWEWHDGDEKWRPLSAEVSDEQAFADGRKQGIADVREAISAIELIDALGGSPPNDGDLIYDEARALSNQSVNVMRSVSALLRSTRQIGKKVAERRALDDAERNRWIVENKLWEPQEATPVSGSRLRVQNVHVFAEAAPGVAVSAVSAVNQIPVMVGTVPTSIVAVDEDDDSTGGEVTIAHHVKWTSEGPITIRRVIE